MRISRGTRTRQLTSFAGVGTRSVVNQRSTARWMRGSMAAIFPLIAEKRSGRSLSAKVMGGQ